MIVPVVVEGQSLRWYGRIPEIADNSIEFVQLEFRFPEDWDGMVIVAQFTQTKTYNCLLVNNRCFLPRELVAGPCEVSVFGYLNEEVTRGTTIPLKLNISRSGFVSSAETPIPPTPDLYAQLVDYFSHLVDTDSSDSNIFVAVYGKTTNAEIVEAYESGKLLFVRHGSALFPCNASITTTMQSFGGVVNGKLAQIYCSNDVWSRNNINLTETISEESTAEEFPTAKAVYDYVSENSDSGGNVDQTTPESFGAVGDGVTDDAGAITLALTASKNVVFDGDKTYAVGSTIVIPADSMVDFRGATIVPTGNHDVIRVMPGSLIENIVVRCTGVPMWDSSAVVLYGGDRFRAYNPTVIKNVKLYNNTSSTAGLTTQGVGIKLYGDQFGDFIEGITVEEASTYGFGIGMLFEGVADDTENTTGGIVFIGANKFRGYWSFYDNQGIVMPNKYPNTHITNNIFTDLQIEPKNRPEKENQSSYGIYCQGFANYFDGCLYDFFYNHTAVYFGSGSARNVVKTTSNSNYDIDNPVRYVDLGVNNTVTTYNRENADFVPYTATTPRMDGNQDDWFAFIDRRATCTLESFDGDPVSGSLANVFDPTPYKTLLYKTINPDVNNRRARITINCNIAMRRLSNFYIQFYSAPKSIKVTFYNNTDATVVYDTDDNVNEIVGICSPTKFAEDYEYNVAKIVIELGGFSKIKTEGAETYGTWELVRIMAVDSYRTGNVWMRRDGGEMYGNIKFTQDKGVVLTSASGNKFLLTVSDDGTLSTSAYTEEQEEAPEVAVLTPTLLPGASWYNVESSGIVQSEITSVVFDSTYVSTGEEDSSWACDEDENGNIMAYRNGTEVTIKSTTGSDGVKLNPDSAYMFANDGTNANFAVLANVGGTDTLRADNKTSASNMFNGNKAITGLIYIPEGVTEMARAFNGCTALTTPPVLPEGLVNLNTAFSGCSALLELPEIPDTVTNLYYAFMGCTAATKPPSAISAKVTQMSYAFRNCVRLTGTIVVDSTATAYTNCFQSAGRDTENGLVLTGSSPYLTELAATAGTNGKVTVAT